MIPAAGTRAQEAREIDDTPELFAADIQAKSNGRSAAHLVEAYTRASAETLGWLEKTCGLSFELVDGVPPGHGVARMHALAERGGTALMSALYRALAARGVRLQPSACVTDLYVDAEQRVRGVRVLRGGRESMDIGCSALVVATNGFAGNVELVNRHLPDVRALPFAGHDGSQGDALAWGGELGAAVEDIDGFQAHSSVVMPQKLQLPWALMSEGAIQVNRQGERFGNEHEGYSESALFVLAQPEGIAFNIYDERIHEVGLAMPNYPEAVTKGLIKRGTTLRDLADALGIDRGGLEQTIALVNALALDEDMDEFGRTFPCGPDDSRAVLRSAGDWRAARHRRGARDRRARPRAASRWLRTAQPARRRWRRAWHFGRRRRRLPRGQWPAGCRRRRIPCRQDGGRNRLLTPAVLVYATAVRSHVHSSRYGSRCARTAQD